MERLQNLLTLTFFLYYKTFSIKSRKLTSCVIGCATEKGKIFVKSLLSLILKHKKRIKLIARRDKTLFIQPYEFSCCSTPQSSQPLRSRIKSSYKLLPCLSANALNVESESVVILPREMIRHSTQCYNNSGVVLAIEGPQMYNSSTEHESSSTMCDNVSSGALVPTDFSCSPAGSTEVAFTERICNATMSSCNGSGAILAMDHSLWSPIRSKVENFVEPDIDWLAEEFIQGFYRKLREQTILSSNGC